MTGICPHCGKEFVKRRSNQIYCSDKSGTCAHCGKEFTKRRSNQLYCSDKCRWAAAYLRFREVRKKRLWKKGVRI